MAGVSKLCRANPVKLPNAALKAICDKLLTLTDPQVIEFMGDITKSETANPAYYLTNHVDDLTVDLVGTWQQLYPSQFEERFDYLDAVNTVVKTYKYRIWTPHRYDVTISNENGAFETHFEQNKLTAAGGTVGGGAVINRNQLLNLVPLIRDVAYVVDADFTYRTDQYGRVRLIEALLRDGPNRRDKGQQRKAKEQKDGRVLDIDTDDDEILAVGADRKDDGGHMIGAQFNGPVEQINYFPQQFFSNQNGTWKKMETQWKRVLYSEITSIGTDLNKQTFRGPVSVEVEITPIFPDEEPKPKEKNRRPSSFEVRYFYNKVEQDGVNNPDYKRSVPNP